MYVEDKGIFCNNCEMHENFVSKITHAFELHKNKNPKFLKLEIVQHTYGISSSQMSHIKLLLIKKI